MARLTNKKIAKKAAKHASVAKAMKTGGAKKAKKASAR